MSQAEQQIKEAVAAYSRKEFDRAEGFARQALALDPSDANAQLMLGIACARTGNPEALDILPKVLEAAPDNADAFLAYTMALRQAGRAVEAIPYASRISELRPQDVNALANLGFICLEAWDLGRAAEVFKRGTALKADSAAMHHGLGRVLMLQGRNSDAVRALKRAGLLAPSSFEIVSQFAQALFNEDLLEEAEHAAKKALKLKPDSAAARIQLAEILLALNRGDEANALIDSALEIAPQDPGVYRSAAGCLQSLGRFEEAKSYLEKSIELQPAQGIGYMTLAYNRKVTEENRGLVDKMRAALGYGLNPREEAYLEFGLGKALEDLGEYERAIGHFHRANELSRKVKFDKDPFDVKQFAYEADWTIQTFTPAFFEQHEKLGNRSNVPIVVAGMMRSGTTLLEQILSRHPDICAAGEQKFWSRNAGSFFDPKGTFKPETLSPSAEAYMKQLRAICPEAPRITDKYPGNYMYLGLIHLAFPKAKIFHTRRNPVDTCISIYTTPGMGSFGHEPETIVFAYEQYLRIVEHWRAVLPKDRFMEVQYEELVADQEAVTRAAIDFLGLPWTDACLNPEENRRMVGTPSLWQVRQPIYKTSLERWRRYEPWLGAFRNLLRGDYP